jgi:hypothetical protein
MKGREGGDRGVVGLWVTLDYSGLFIWTSDVVTEIGHGT